MNKFQKFMGAVYKGAFGIMPGQSRDRYPDDYTEYEQEYGIEPDVNYDDLVAVYGNSAWVYAAITAIAQSGMSVPLVVYHRKDASDPDSWEPDSDNELYDLLNHPNQHQTWSDLCEGTLSYLELTGNAYWELVTKEEKRAIGKRKKRYVRKQMPRGIYLIKAQNMRPVPDRKLKYKGFVYEANGERIMFDAQDVIHHMYFNPKCEWYGQSPMRASIAAITLDFYSIAYNRDFFKNQAKPEGVLQIKGTLSPPAYKRLKRDWDKKFKGLGKSRQTAILEEGMEFKPLSLAPEDMQFVQQRKFSREEILSVFGVPPIKVGILDGASYANAREQDTGFWQETMVPKLSKLRDWPGIIPNAPL